MPMPDLAAVRREGMAEAVVLLVANRAVPPAATVGLLAQALGLEQAEVKAALTRVRARTARERGVRLVRPAVVPDGHKWCPWAGHVAPRTDFGANAAKPDGLSPYCRECCRERRMAERLGTIKPRPRPTSPRRQAKKDVERRANAAQHGTRSMYVRGCGCEDCRRAQREYTRDYEARRKQRKEGAA